MWHSLHVESFSVRLCPVQVTDAVFIVWLGNLGHVLGRVGDSAGDLAGQQAWLHAYFVRGGDYYFIVETLGGILVGTHGIYDVIGTSAEHGRFIMRPEVPAALACLMNGFDLAFGPMGFTELRGTVVSTNQKVLSLNRKLGFRQINIEPSGWVIGCKPADMVHSVLLPEGSAKARDRFLPLARLAETEVLQWEQAQEQN
jgi:hypothetical protein